MRKVRGRYTGRWRVDGPLLCLAYFADVSHNDCWTFALEANEVRFYDKSTGRLDGSVALRLDANPKNL